MSKPWPLNSIINDPRKLAGQPVSNINWAEVAEKFQKAIVKNKKSDDWEKIMIPTDKTKGWAAHSGVFQSVDDVRVVLPPGIYRMDTGDGKKFFTPVQSPSDSPIDLPGLPSKYLLDQIKLFWSRADRYAEYNFLQKRGILLYGAPGCGKTSIINLLCQDLIGIGGVIFMIDDFEIANACIRHFRTIEPDRPIMTLMEDIEGVFKGEQGNGEIKAALEPAGRSGSG